MITFENFKRFIEASELFNTSVDKLYDLKIDIIESGLFKSYGNVEDVLITSLFKGDGIDYINWWLYERKDYTGNISNTLLDFEGNKIEVNSIAELWDLVKDYRI